MVKQRTKGFGYQVMGRKTAVGCFLLLLQLWLYGCSQLDNGLPDFRIEPEKTMASHSEAIVVQITQLEQEGIVEWFLDGDATGIQGESFTLSSSSNSEQRHLVHAEVDGLKSNTVEIFFTEYPKLIETVYNFIDKYGIETAVSVAVYNPDTSFQLHEGRTSLSKAGGANTETTLHYLYSISKTFVSAAALSQVKAKTITLDSKLSEILPDLSSSFLNEDATLKELLTHRSGIYDYVDNPLLYAQNPFRENAWDPELLFDFIRTPSGESGLFSYSTTNFLLVGMMLENVAGKALNTLLAETFLTPLSLQNLYLLPQDTVNESLISHPHVYPYTALSLVGDGETPIDTTTIIPDAIELLGKSSWAGGGMVGNAWETALWGYHLYSLKSTSIDADVKSQIANSVADFEKSDSNISYGYGVRKLFYEDTYFLGSYGRSVGSENLMFYNPDTDTCFVVLTSSNANKDGNPNIDELLFDLHNAVAEDS